MTADATGTDDPTGTAGDRSVSSEYPSHIAPETAVSTREEMAGRCSYCDRPFRDERALALHLGEAHEDRLSENQREEYETALEAERDELFYFHMKVVVAIGSLYALTVLAYMIALGSGII